VGSECRDVIYRHATGITAISFIERFAFYERVQNAFAMNTTGETCKYGDATPKKGVL
jgi:L-fucose mutarotase/ribose pyranase (RbsD/FucU family)